MTNQVVHIRHAIQPVLRIGPDFLAGSIDADVMANTMVAAATECLSHKVTPQDSDANATTLETQQLDLLVAELHTCGSGYLAKRCEADCVARTMTQVIGEFGHLAIQN